MSNRIERVIDHLFLLPAALFLVIFVFYPLGANVVFGFQQFTLGADSREYVGFDNYSKLFTDPVIRTALKNNVAYACISILFQVGISHVLAATVMFVLPRRWAVVARSIYFIPVLLSVTVVGILFTFIYNSRDGLVNTILEAIGLESLKHPWLGDPSTAIWSVISVSQWQSVGYTMLLFIVAMQGISKEQYEAASLDGAGAVRQYLTVTLPQTREMLFVVTLLTTAGAFTVFNEPYIMTGGGPGNATQTLATYMYNQGFFQNQMGYAAAISTLMLVITLILAFAQMALFRTGKE